MRTVIFITGAERSGKSTLANQIISCGKSQHVMLSDFLRPFSCPFNPDCDWIVFDEEINERRHVKVLNGVLVLDEFEY
jgi:predicted AAA+ superfamily ATPase